MTAPATPAIALCEDEMGHPNDDQARNDLWRNPLTYPESTVFYHSMHSSPRIHALSRAIEHLATAIVLDPDTCEEARTEAEEAIGWAQVARGEHT